MSVTVQQIILDAKRLAERLKERDSVADLLLNEAHSINKKIDAMKQYQEEVEVLNEVARPRPHAQLIARIQQENRHLREIQQENQELRAALEDHQTALEHIMSKYRQHTSKQIYESRINFKAFQDGKYVDVIQNQADKIQEMAFVMNKAASLDEDRITKEEETVARLKTENKGLRELLEISYKYGSLGKPLVTPVTEDKTIQTEPSS